MAEETPLQPQPPFMPAVEGWTVHFHRSGDNPFSRLMSVAGWDALGRALDRSGHQAAHNRRRVLGPPRNPVMDDQLRASTPGEMTHDV